METQTIFYLGFMKGGFTADKGKLGDSKKGVDVAEVYSDGGEYYDLVRRSDGATRCSLKLHPGDRMLVNFSGVEIGYKRLQRDEHVISRETLVEIIREFSARN
ncbi:hypothetical protein [Enterobacter soli]|uniref:hypothetical protein n=1 Tax=Enterobacter soli TaxID=885040 RepID=UPI0034CEBC3B